MSQEIIQKETQVFIMLPKALFKPPYDTLSLYAKMLYALLYDRHRLSVRTNRRDKNGNYYIYYTVQEIANNLSCSKAHAIKILDELDCTGGAGLIKRRKQGQGKPSMIYVNVIAEQELSDNTLESENQSEPASFSEFNGEEFSDAEFNENDFMNSTVCTSRSKDSLPQEVNEVKSINNDNINNYNINTDSFISDHIITENKNTINDTKGMIEKRNLVKDIVKTNIDYSICVYDFGESWTNGIVEIITDVVCSDDKYIRINKKDYPKDLVADRFLELKHEHIQNVYMTMKTITSPVKNVRSYMITVLYRSYETADYWLYAKAYSDLEREKNSG